MDIRHEILDAAKNDLILRVRSHPFLEGCRNGTVTLDQLKCFLVQQSHYSAYFTRYLCALMGNLPSNSQVLELAENLFEELGFDKSSVDHSTPHYVIYQDMLKKFNLSAQSAEKFPQTRKLIDTMLSYCKNDNPAYGLGAICLGAEAIVSVIYADIIKGFQACGVDVSEIPFFRIHVECDDGHAETIRDIMVDVAANDHEQIKTMVTAGNDLVDARLNFFSGILERSGKATSVNHQGSYTPSQSL
jgi:thiaminase